MLGIEFLKVLMIEIIEKKNSLNQTIIEKIYNSFEHGFSNVKHAIQNSNLNCIFIQYTLYNNFMLLLAHVDDCHENTKMS